jgi:hypothetical protein
MREAQLVISFFYKQIPISTSRTHKGASDLAVMSSDQTGNTGFIFSMCLYFYLLNNYCSEPARGSYDISLPNVLFWE